MDILSPEDTRAAWDRVAPGYNKHVTPTHMWAATEGLRCAGLRSGMRFLDVAAGSSAFRRHVSALGFWQRTFRR